MNVTEITDFSLDRHRRIIAFENFSHVTAVALPVVLRVTWVMLNQNAPLMITRLFRDAAQPSNQPVF